MDEARRSYSRRVVGVASAHTPVGTDVVVVTDQGRCYRLVPERVNAELEVLEEARWEEAPPVPGTAAAREAWERQGQGKTSEPRQSSAL